MAQLCVGDKVKVVGLQRATQYNDRVGVVTRIVHGEPEVKCEIRLENVGLENEPDDKQIRLRMAQLERHPPRAAGPVQSEPCPEPPQRLRRAFTQRAPPPPVPRQPSGDWLDGVRIRRMDWGSLDPKALEQTWVREIQKMDSDWLIRAKMNLWLYLVRKLSHVLTNTKGLKEAGLIFYYRRVQELHYGYVWGHGGKEQEQPLPLDVMVGGIQWWPVIWVGVEGILQPCYCPGLAWQGSRPWFAHSTRLGEVDTPQEVADENMEGWTILSVSGGD